MVATSEIAVSLTIDDNSSMPLIIDELQKFGVVEVDENQAIICVVGNNVMYQQGVTQSVLHALDNIPLRMISFGGSKNNISFLVKAEYKNEALRQINRNIFNLSEVEE